MLLFYQWQNKDVCLYTGKLCFCPFGREQTRVTAWGSARNLNVSNGSIPVKTFENVALYSRTWISLSCLCVCDRESADVDAACGPARACHGIHRCVNYTSYSTCRRLHQSDARVCARSVSAGSHHRCRAVPQDCPDGATSGCFAIRMQSSVCDVRVALRRANDV